MSGDYKLVSEDDVRKEVVRILNYYQSIGVVLNWERINCGRVQSFGRWFYGAKEGFSDYFVEVVAGKIIFLYFIETKRPVGGRWSDEQIAFAAKHSGFLNVFYDLVSEPKIVSDRLEEISKYTFNSLEEAETHLFNKVK